MIFSNILSPFFLIYIKVYLFFIIYRYFSYKNKISCKGDVCKVKTIKNTVFIPKFEDSLQDIQYRGCTFIENNFYKGTIVNCQFIECDLSESNFSKAILSGCTFIDCKMEFCSMICTQIYRSTFERCNIWNSNLCHSSVYDSEFHKCIIRALFKDLDWQGNIFDISTIVESCGGTCCNCCNMNKKIVKK